MRLSTAVRRFVTYKRAQGRQYKNIAVFLLSFAREMGDCSVSNLTPSRISAFLNTGERLPYTRVCRYNTLCVFFRFLRQIEKLKRWPMPDPPPKPDRTYVPYIFSRAEIRRVIDCKFQDCFGRRTLIEPITFRTILLLLYGTGISFTEAITLRRDHVDFVNRTIEIAIREGGKTRIIPIGTDVCKLLMCYLKSRAHVEGRTPCLFVTSRGEPVNHRSLRRNFKRLCRAAGVTRHGVGYSEPRMHDLRYTFAVHRIASWYRMGANLQKLIPALAVYMGRAGMRSTERMLSLTPEHLASSGGRYLRVPRPAYW